MLLPRETHFLEGLNSYYIDIAKLTEHLQGDLGSGCIYCQSTGQELLIYFDEHAIIRAVVQNSGQTAQVYHDLGPVLDELKKKNYHITVNYLDQNAIYLWAHMPSFQRAGKNITAATIALPVLLHRLKEKLFSGFVDVELVGGSESALLFFHNGVRTGGSYSWGKGGLNTSEHMFNELLTKAQHPETLFKLGSFIEQKQQTDDENPASGDGESTVPAEESAPHAEAENNEIQSLFSDLETALAEYMEIYSQVLRKKTKIDPVILLKQRFVLHKDEFPFLDPFASNIEFVDGQVIIGQGVPRREIAGAVVRCANAVMEEHRLTKKFAAILEKWSYREALEDRGIQVIP